MAKTASDDTSLARIAPDEIHIPRNWDYNTSVNAMRPMVKQFADMWQTLVPELATARAALTAQGRRSDLGARAPKLPTWEQYCRDIGISKSQANRQIAGYVHSPKREKAAKTPPAGKTPCPRCNGTGYIKGDQDIIDAEIVPQSKPEPRGKLTAEQAREEAFEDARKLYPGVKRSHDTEWQNFKRKTKDYKTVVADLVYAVRIQIVQREDLKDKGEFVPPWKHFQTWINNRWWETADDA